MFILVRMKDAIPIPAHNLDKPRAVAVSHQIEEKIRDKYQTDKVKIRVVGFAKKMGDMLDGANEVAKAMAHLG